jgi:hypothetical protein
MLKTLFGQYNIEIVDDNYTVGSVDNRSSYDVIYIHPEDDAYCPTSSCGIAVNADGLRKAAIILANGGATRVGPNSALIDGENLVLICCNKVFCLHLPDLVLNWVIKADVATCFGIYQYELSYIIHGETAITRLGQFGNIVWQVGARDIFVNIEHSGLEFEMNDEYIQLMDWQGHRYKLYYDGAIVDNGIGSLIEKKNNT